ncbi:MAG: hypothetical protein DRG40_00390 [Deltaproteobacteria bacterium]|nr:MAG: hypothetical protein DRG40_00390 [Deltaproteobacteria bacterium]
MRCAYCVHYQGAGSICARGRGPRCADECESFLDGFVLKKIREYNEQGQHYDHYVRIPKELARSDRDVLAVIEWKGYWSWWFVELEDGVDQGGCGEEFEEKELVFSVSHKGETDGV